ncbi:MAG: T9SS C-terminal target domain-containing protein [Calditrichaeota bacterium]|nr:MAG: T9SS C-terminal target domain-containing protein [Calditrichota bacterium]
MKNICISVLIGLLMLAFTAQSATIELPDHSLDRWLEMAQNEDNQIKTFKISESNSLPYLTYFLEVNDSTEIRSLNLISSNVFSTGSQILIHKNDIPTSIDVNLYTDIKSSASLNSIGFKPIIIHDPVWLNNQKYLKIQIFPVTTDMNGNIIKHTNFQIDYINSEIKQTALLSQTDFDFLFSNGKQNNTYASTGYPEYLIVTNQELSEAFSELASYKNQIGISTEISLIDDILASSTGRDDAEKLRNYLKEFYNNGGLYLLLGGDETVIPIRYAYHNAAYSDISIEDQQVSDLYYADLTGDWNLDNDNVWGEKYTDDVDLTPELYVGRLPFNSSAEVSNYVAKLINYETNRYNHNLDYLEDIFIFASDQMRDYETAGQHAYLAQAFPSSFTVDTTNGIEKATGEDANPTNKSAIELEPVISSGYGIINIVAHGSNSSFAVRTSGYNDWPKSYFTTDTNYWGHGNFHALSENGNISFYASLGCDNGAFDKDQPPFNQAVPNVVQTLLGLENRGAVGFIANSRWGWVSTSYLLQRRFLDYVIANPELPACDAMYKMKDDYYYYRDLILGINYFGDPTMKIYTFVPESIDFAVNHSKSTIGISLSSNGEPLDSVRIVISADNQILSQYITNISTSTEIEYDFNLGTEYTISAIKQGYTIKQISYTPSIVTDVDDYELNLPSDFSLFQNYPNPFNPSTTIEFALPTNGYVSLDVYNTLGQKVAELVNQELPAGYHSVIWNGKNKNGTDIASGLYFYKLKNTDFTETKKMLLIR